MKHKENIVNEKEKNTLNKSKIDKRLYITSIVLSSLYLLLYIGLGILIFKNMFYTFAAMPFILSIIALMPLTFSILNIVIFKRRWLSISLICISILLALGYFLFAAYVLSKLTFLIFNGLPYLIVIAIIAIFLFLILIYPRLNKLWKRISVSMLSVVIACVSVFGVLELSVFTYTSDGVVFAVEDEYQIAWSTSIKSVGYITIGENTYYDQNSGTNNVSKLHKVSVPMSVLDEAKTYSLHSIPVYSETAYLSINGKEVTKTYDFRPVNTTDGLQIYNLSDTHEVLSGPSKAGSYYGDNLDLLVLNGDIINDVSSYYQISLIYKLASKITSGTRPVIFVRGNHECVGKYASSLADYVGSRDGEFYYTVELGDAFIMVLDTINYMEDDYWLVSPQSNFEIVREEESEWLSSLEYFGEDHEYKLLFAHMAFALTNYSNYPEWTNELINATNGKFDVLISGHSHILDYAEATIETNTSYPAIRGSIRSNNRYSGEGVSPTTFTGTAIECIDGSITAKFTNAKGKVLEEFLIK